MGTFVVSIVLFILFFGTGQKISKTIRKGLEKLFKYDRTEAHRNYMRTIKLTSVILVTVMFLTFLIFSFFVGWYLLLYFFVMAVAFTLLAVFEEKVSAHTFDETMLIIVIVLLLIVTYLLLN